MSAQTAALIINVVSAVLTVILGRMLLKRHVTDPNLVLAGSAIIAVGWPLLQVTSLAIPEPLTVVALLALILVLESFGEAPRPRISLFAVVVLLNLTFFLRYAAVAFIPVAIVVVFFARRRTDTTYQRIVYTAGTTLLAVLGPALWMLRNHSVDGSLLGPRYPPVFGIATVAHQYVLATAKLFLPGPNIFEDLVFVVVVVLTCYALRLVYTAEPGGVGAFVRRLEPWSVLLLMCIVYVVYLYAAELSTKIDPIDSRLLVPIYVPSLILLIGLMESVLSKSSLSTSTKRLWKRALALFLVVQVSISCAIIGDFAIEGRGYTSSAWRTSTLVTASKSLKGATYYYTNNPAGLWARLGGDNIYALPASISQDRKVLTCPGARVVYFSQGPGVYYGESNGVSADITAVKLTALKAVLGVKQLFVSSEGSLLGAESNPGARVHCP